MQATFSNVVLCWTRVRFFLYPLSDLLCVRFIASVKRIYNSWIGCACSQVGLELHPTVCVWRLSIEWAWELRNCLVYRALFRTRGAG